MADKTYGFKVGEEFYEKAKFVIETSGMTNKEWFERAVALYEMNAIKEGSVDYKQDLTELEHHTTRMYELIVNMIQRSVYLKDHAVKEVTDKLQSKDNVVSNLQQQLQNAKDTLLANESTIDEQIIKITELEEKLANIQLVLTNNQALIEEYKEKNDALSGLVVKYKEYAIENEQIKEESEHHINELQVKYNNDKNELLQQLKLLEERCYLISKELEMTQKDFNQAKLNHKHEIELLVEQKKLEKAQALVEQQAIHNEEVRKLYDELENLRKLHQQMKEQLQNEIMQLRESKK